MSRRRVEDLSFCFLGLQESHPLAAAGTTGRNSRDACRQQSERGRFRIRNNTESGARRRLGEQHMLWPSGSPGIWHDFLFLAPFNIHRFNILLLLSNAPELSSRPSGRIGESLIAGRPVNISSHRLENDSLWIGHPSGRRTERGAGLKHVS